jgi:hypothetical protein
VVIRGLSIQGFATGSNGIRILSAKAVYVENSTISGFQNAGIDFQPTAAGTALHVTNTEIRNNGLNATAPNPDTRAGIFADTTSGGAPAISVDVDGSHLEGNRFGVSIRNNVRAVIHNSTVTNNQFTGVLVQPTSTFSDANLERVAVTFNGGGLQAGGGGGGTATLRMSNAMVTDNNAGLVALAGGSIVSFGNNSVFGNGTSNGPPTSTIGQQ